VAEFERFYKELNKEQKEAVDTLEGPVLVLAGPGTGKTQILSVRAANIIRRKLAAPENILILTYTNAAAKTMKERLAKIAGFRGYDVNVCTFHSFANSIILDSEEAINYIQEKIQISDIEKVKAIEYILDHSKDAAEIRPFNAPYIYLKEISQRIGELKREGVSPGEFLECLKTMKPDGVYIEEKHIPRLKAFAIVYDQYERLKEGGNKDVFDERGRYDYEDMLMIAREALEKEKGLKKRYENQYRFIMVDEFQDTNGAQLKFLFTFLNKDNPNLCCVGDDDQSIYRFQGASSANFKELKKRFKGLKSVALKTNYRSTSEIITLYHSIIKEIPGNERISDKELVNVRDFKEKSIECYEFTTEEEEMVFLVDKIRELKEKIEKSKDLTKEEKEFPYNNIAILLRKRALILRVIDKLLQAGIPYATDGKEDIGSEARVRQMMDALELASVDPENFEDKDKALYKVLISDYFRIPLRDILEFISKVNRKRREKKEATLLSEFMAGEGLSAPLKAAKEAITNLLKNSNFNPIHSVLMEYIDGAGIYRYILEKYDKDSVVKIRELRALTSFVNMVKSSDLSRPGITLKEFTEELRTRSGHDMSIQGELVTMTQNGVRVFTAHGSKGQEFQSVIIPFCLQDKSWPSKPKTDSIPMPQDLIRTMERVDNKERIKELHHFDEARLFYVAVSRAKSNIIFTSSPEENSVSSSFLSRMGPAAMGSGLGEEETLVKSLEKTRLEDPFIGTEEVLRDLVADIRLNPTSLNNYLECGRKFLYDNVLMLPSGKKQSLIFGNAVHSGLEHLFLEYMRKGRFPDFQFFKEKFSDALKFQGPEKGVELRCRDQFEGIRRYYERLASRPIKPLGLENRMPINIDGIIFTGKYDKLETEDAKQKSVRVVDYKTGQPNKHARGIFDVRSLEDENCDGYFRQLVCYKLLYERDTTRQDKDLIVTHGVLAFVEPARENLIRYGIKKGEPTEFKVALTDEMVDEIVSVIKNTWRGIQELRFEKLPERDRKKCDYCDFDHICWG